MRSIEKPSISFEDQYVEIKVREFYRDPASNKPPEPVPWDKAKQNDHQIIMIFAAPGMGKSTLLRREAWLKARETRQHIECNTVAIDESVLPIYLEFKAISEEWVNLNADQEFRGSRRATILHSILNCSLRRLPESLHKIESIMKDKLERGKCYLLIDALNEVDNTYRRSLIEDFSNFVEDFKPTRVICSSRYLTNYYGIAQGKTVFFELEIAAFDVNQRKEFIRKQAKKYADLTVYHRLEEYCSSHRFLGLMQSPLLLSLLCHQAKLENEIPNDFSISLLQLYEKIVCDTIEDRPGRLSVPTKIILAKQLSYDFSLEGKSSFSEAEFTQWFESYCEQDDSLKSVRAYNDRDLLSELEEDQILQRIEGRIGYYKIFFHSTFQEFLAASYVLGQIEDNYKGQAHKQNIVKTIVDKFKQQKNNDALFGFSCNLLLEDFIRHNRNEDKHNDCLYKTLWYQVNHKLNGDNPSHRSIMHGFSSANDKNDYEHLASMKQMLSKVFVDYYLISDKHQQILDMLLKTVKNYSNTSSNTMNIALECISNIIRTEKYKYSRIGISKLLQSIVPSEIEVLQHALCHSSPSVRLEAARIAATTYTHDNNAPTFFFPELTRKIISYLHPLNLLSLVLNTSKRKELSGMCQSLLHMMLFLLGSDIADNSYQQIRYYILTEAGRVVKNKYFRIAIVLFKTLIAKEFNKVYRDNVEKKIPCNYLEIHLSQKHSDQTQKIFELFNLEDDWVNVKSDILELCSVPNGLISWYLYTIIPIHVRRRGQADRIIDVLQEIYEIEGERASDNQQLIRFVVQKSLWALTEFSQPSSEIPLKKIETLFEKYSLRFLDKYGPLVGFRHNESERNIICRYMKSDSLYISYDNAIMVDYAVYQLRRRNLLQFDFITKCIEEKNWTDNDKKEYMLSCINALGQIGTLYNAEPTLKTLQYIIKKINVNSYSHDELSDIKEEIRCTLLKIRRFFPYEVEKFIEEFDDSNCYFQIKEATRAQKDNEFELTESYHGAMLFQKSFAMSDEVRKMFSKVIKESSTYKTPDKLFKKYITQAFRDFSELTPYIPIRMDRES
jgi:hypothetical protein